MMSDITSTDELYRRLFEYYVKPDNSISSAAFMDKGKPDPRCSVYLARLTNPVEILSLGVAKQRVAVLEAGVPLGLGLVVEHDGVGHPSHCLIIGMTSKAQCKSLALKCRPSFPLLAIDSSLKGCATRLSSAVESRHDTELPQV